MGMVEVVIASAVFIVTAAVAGKYIVQRIATSTSFSEKAACRDVPDNILRAITNLNNDSIVRNFMPVIGGQRAPADARDPFCNGRPGHHDLCDSNDHFTQFAAVGLGCPGLVGAEGEHDDEHENGFRDPAADESDNNPCTGRAPRTPGEIVITDNGISSFFRNYQNVRGAAVWAQSMYNTYADICVGEGHAFTRDDFVSLFPSPIDLPTWVSGITLRISQQNGGACGVVSDPKSPSTTQFEIKASVQTTRGTTVGSCSSQALVNFPPDTSSPVTSVVVRNGAGEIVPYGKCTCQRAEADAIASGCPEANDVSIELKATEPGVIFMCSKTGPTGDQQEAFELCSNIRFQGRNIASTAIADRYNSPMDYSINFNGLPRLDNATYGLRVKAIDVGGNESNIAMAAFKVKISGCANTCPSTNLYCPNAVANGTNYMRRPADTSVVPAVLCPIGTLPGGIGCSNPGTFCGAPNPATDVCGNACPAGRCGEPPPEEDHCSNIWSNACLGDDNRSWQWDLINNGWTDSNGTPLRDPDRFIVDTNTGKVVDRGPRPEEGYGDSNGVVLDPTNLIVDPTGAVVSETPQEELGEDRDPAAIVDVAPAEEPPAEEPPPPEEVYYDPPPDTGGYGDWY